MGVESFVKPNARSRFWKSVRIAIVAFVISLIFFSSLLLTSLRSNWSMQQLLLVAGLIYSLLLGIVFFALAKYALDNEANIEERLEKTQILLLRNEKTAFVGLLVSTYIHDFNNIIAVLNLNLERIRIMPEKPEILGNLIERFQDGFYRLSELVKSLKAKDVDSATLSANETVFDLGVVINKQIEFMKEHKWIRNCRIEFKEERKILVLGSSVYLHQLLLNLLLSAGEATNGRGTIGIRILSLDSGLCLDVYDDSKAVGFKAREKSLIEDREATVGISGALIIGQKCAEYYGGRLEIMESPLGGAKVRAFLPELEWTEIGRISPS